MSMQRSILKGARDDKMPNFSELFFQTKGQPIRYKENTLVMVDQFPFENGDQILIIFEKTNSKWKQGIGFILFGFFEVDGKRYPDRIVLWEDTSPKEQIITLFYESTKRKQPKGITAKGLLAIKNIWDTGTGTIQSWFGGAAMIVEEIENGRRYRCNDGHPDENFDDIVFTVQRLPKVMV